VHPRLSVTSTGRWRRRAPEASQAATQVLRFKRQGLADSQEGERRRPIVAPQPVVCLRLLLLPLPPQLGCAWRNLLEMQGDRILQNCRHEPLLPRPRGRRLEEELHREDELC